jgi:hypothetical protein
VILPLARPGFITAAILGFAHTVGEFGVVLMIGGNIPDKTRVVSVQIYDHVEAMEYAQAHWLAGAMLVFSFLVLLALYSSQNQSGLELIDDSNAPEIELPGFHLDVDLQLPGRGVTRCMAIPGPARPPACAASPGWKGRSRLYPGQR